MSIDYDALTDEIIQGMADTNPETNNVIKNILKTEIGDTILCRFVLYTPNPKQSMYHYQHHGWKTNTGQYVSYFCPSTVREMCPICRKSIGFWKSNNEFQKEKSKKIRRKENWLVNVYVIDDSKHPENNGKVKIMRFGRQIQNVIEEATTGVDKEIFGKNIWRMDKRGCNFRITCKPNSDKKDAWPSYTASKFLPPSDLGLDDDEVNAIFDSTFDLSELFDKMYSYDELNDELQKNFINDMQMDEELEDEQALGNLKPSIKSPPRRPAVEDVVEDEEDEEEEELDMSPPPPKKKVAKKKTASKKKKEEVDDEADDDSDGEADDGADEIDRMIEELG